MSLLQKSTTHQIEIACVDGLPAHVFREILRQVFDGESVISSAFHRESYPADSEEAKGVLGDTLAGALAQVQAIGAELAAAKEQVHALTERSAQDADTIQALQSQVAALQTALDASAQADPVDVHAQVRAIVQQELAASKPTAPWWRRFLGLA